MYSIYYKRYLPYCTGAKLCLVSSFYTFIHILCLHLDFTVSYIQDFHEMQNSQML